MALGPKASKAAVERVEEAKRENIKRERERNRGRALQLVLHVAKWAEIALDKSISNGRGPCATPHSIEDASLRYTFFFKNVVYRCSQSDAKLVIEFASEELKKILEDTYLPKGWKKVIVGIRRIGEGGFEYFSKEILLE